MARVVVDELVEDDDELDDVLDVVDVVPPVPPLGAIAATAPGRLRRGKDRPIRVSNNDTPEEVSAVRISAGVAVSRAPANTATAPATWGDAIEVPDMVAPPAVIS